MQIKRLCAALLTAVLIFCLCSCAGVGGVTLARGGKTDFVIALPVGASSNEKATAKSIAAAFLSVAKTKIQTIPTENTKANGIKEIVIKSTATGLLLPENCAPLRTLDTVVFYDGEDVCLLGGSGTALENARNAFISNYIKSSSPSVSKHLFDRTDGDYSIGLLTVNGLPITAFDLVYTNCDDYFSYTAAMHLQAVIKAETGYEPKCLSEDTENIRENRIMIGSLNNELCKKADHMFSEHNQYAEFFEDGMAILTGKNYMTAGAVAQFIKENLTGKENNAEVNVQLSDAAGGLRTFEFLPADSAILLIGDGMGFNHIAYAKSEGYFTDFSAEAMPNHGECTTRSASSAVTDSAAAGTALATGKKTKNGYLGIDEQKRFVKNIRERAEENGCQTAILTTDSLTGATPAAFTVHCDSRSDTDTIRTQQAELTDAVLKSVPNGSLAGAITDTLDSLQGKPFFLMAEEAYPDKGSHAKNAQVALNAVASMNRSVCAALYFQMFNPSTVVLVTADHECGGVMAYGDSYTFTADGHTGVNVPVFAIGDKTDFFDRKTVDNTEIFTFLSSVFIQ